MSLSLTQRTAGVCWLRHETSTLWKRETVTVVSALSRHPLSAALPAEFRKTESPTCYISGKGNSLRGWFHLALIPPSRDSITSGQHSGKVRIHRMCPLAETTLTSWLDDWWWWLWEREQSWPKTEVPTKMLKTEVQTTHAVLKYAMI